MIIALPTVDNKLCMHFGHCEVFTFLKIDEENKEIIETKQMTPPPHEPGILPPWVAEQGAKIVIAGGMGVKAQQLFENQGVKVIVGAPSESPEKLVKDYLNGILKTGENACSH